MKTRQEWLTEVSGQEPKQGTLLRDNVPQSSVPVDLEGRGIDEVFKPGLAKILIEAGFRKIDDLGDVDLTSIPGIGESKATQIRATLEASHERRLRALEDKIDRILRHLGLD